MRYEIEVHYRGYLPRWTVIEADSDFEAREVARAWIEAMVVPLKECWVTVMYPGDCPRPSNRATYRPDLFRVAAAPGPAQPAE